MSCGANFFAGSEVHVTAIQALSNHKQEYGGQLKEFFFQENSLLCGQKWGEMAVKTHF